MNYETGGKAYMYNKSYFVKYSIQFKYLNQINSIQFIAILNSIQFEIQFISIQFNFNL